MNTHAGSGRQRCCVGGGLQRCAEVPADSAGVRQQAAPGGDRAGHAAAAAAAEGWRSRLWRHCDDRRRWGPVWFGALLCLLCHRTHKQAGMVLEAPAHEPSHQAGFTLRQQQTFLTSIFVGHRCAEDDEKHEFLLRFWAPWTLDWEDPVTGAPSLCMNAPAHHTAAQAKCGLASSACQHRLGCGRRVVVCRRRSLLGGGSGQA